MTSRSPRWPGFRRSAGDSVRWINAKTALTAEMALRIGKAFGADVDHRLRMQVDYDATEVRKRPEEIKVKRYVAKAA